MPLPTSCRVSESATGSGRADSTASTIRDSLAPFIEVTTDDAWTNSMLQSAVCGSLTGTTTIIRIKTAGDVPLLTPLSLPDCFWSAGNLRTILLSSVVVRGNTSVPSPYERIYTTFSQSVDLSLTLASCTLLTDTGALGSLDWGIVATALPRLSTLAITNGDIGNPTLPAQIPGSITVLYLVNCGLKGTIPATLFQLYTNGGGNFFASLVNNELEGALPANLFSALSASTMNSFTFDVSHNKLTGTIPNALIGKAWSSLSLLNVSFAYNQLTGPLTNTFETASFPSTLYDAVMDFSGNRGLTGSIPNWFTSQCAMSRFGFSASGCSLDGTIPNLLSAFGCFASGTISVTIDVSDNQLTGPISASLFHLTGGALSVSGYWTISFANNRLSGPVPANLFQYVFFGNTPTSTQRFDFSNNQLSGGLPDEVPVLTGSAGSTTTLLVDFSSNPLMTGSIPSTLFPSLVDGMDTATSTSPLAITFDVSHTALTGPLEIPDLSYATAMNLNILASGARFSSFSVADGVVSPIATLDLSNNTVLSSFDLTQLISNARRLTTLIASLTTMNVLMPSASVLTSSNLKVLDLRSTSIDFCSGSRTPWASSTLTSCALDATSAFNCQDQYPNSCTFSAPPLSQVPSVDIPIAAPEPTLPPTPTTPSPTSSPVVPSPTPTSSGCSESTRPSPDFYCVGTIWTFDGTLALPVLVIPSGASQTVINGNVTSSTVVINGIGSSVSVNGCASNLTTITIELTEEQVKRLGSSKTLQTLIQLSNASSCDSDLSNVNIEAKVASGCRKVKSERQVSSDGKTLSSFFTVDRSGCNTWWIILVSVVCGVIVLAVIIIALLAVFSPSFRNRIRPYSQRKKHQPDVT